MPLDSYKDLIVWQKAIRLAVFVYQVTEQFPKSELYGLSSQMRRAVISISSNIAEGRSRGTRKDFRQFLIIALGSASELESQIEVVKLLPFSVSIDFLAISALLGEVLRMLHAMINKLEAKS